MNKADLVKLAEGVMGTHQDAHKVVTRLFEAMGKALQQGEKVVVMGFGSFHVVMRKAKPARNPRTGTPVLIPPRRRVKFKMAKGLI